MGRRKDKIEETGDGRPAEVREGQEPEKDNPEEDMPDPSTVDNVGY